MGLAAFLVLIGVGLLVALSAAKSIRPSEDAVLVQALAGALAGVAVLYLFFDALSFAMAGGILFLVLGIIGAANALELDERSAVPETN
jgi:uncharacterized membrane protein HdeD (DUF308 family)